MFKRLMRFLSFLFLTPKESIVSGENQIQVCLNLFSDLNNGLSIDKNTLPFIYIEPRVSNVDAYIDLIDNFIRKINNGKIIKAEDIPDYKKTSSLEMFFVDKDNNYLEPEESLRRLVNSAIVLCHSLLIEQEEIGVHEHNRIITTPVITNLMELVTAFNN